MSIQNASRKLPERRSAPSSSPSSASSSSSASPRVHSSSSRPARPAQETRYEPPTRPRMALDGAPSTLRTEVLGDGSANCLEQATRLARPGDAVLLFRDSRDPVGHAVVQRPDGSVVDPRHPGSTYPDLGSWQAAHPQYHSPERVQASALKQVLSLPPGPQRDAAIAELGLARVANRQVADGALPAMVRVDASDGLSLRAGPGRDNERLQLLGHGTELTVLGRSPDDPNWLRVQAPDGTIGFVHQGYVQATDAQRYEGLGALGDSNTSGGAERFQPGSVGVSPSVKLGSPTQGRTQANLDERTPHFSQGDATYADSTILAFGGTATLKEAGCLITCKAMAISAYQNGEGLPLVSPGDLANTSNSGAVTVGDRTFVEHDVAFSQQNIDHALAQGLPVAVRVDGPYGQHWVLIVGKNEDGSYKARDPGFRVNKGVDDNCKDLTLTWQGDTLVGQAPDGSGGYTANTSVNMHLYAPEEAYTPLGG
jgi:hypothetical protein